MADRAVNLETVIGMVNTYFRNVLNLNPDLLIDGIVSLPTVDAIPCDVCRYSPPSSGDGKPCTICPAEGARMDGDNG